MKNQMYLNNEDILPSAGFEVFEIRKLAKENPKDPCWKEYKRELVLWNKFAKQLHKHNKNLTTDWINLKRNYSTDNHIVSFINKIFNKLKKKELDLEDIHSIIGIENSTRGLAATMTMYLKDSNNNIILNTNEYMNKFYYM